VTGELLLGAVRAGPEGQLQLVDDELGGGEEPEVADVVVVEVRDQHLFDSRRVDAEAGERGGGLDRAGASARPSDAGVEAGVDDDRAPAPAHEPEVVVHAQWRVRLAVGLEAEERPAEGRLQRPVADRDDRVAAARH